MAISPRQGGSGEEDGESNLDIDALASQLSQAAGDLKKSMDTDPDARTFYVPDDDDEDDVGRPSGMGPPRALQTSSTFEAELLAGVGPGGFQLCDFELFRALGQVQVQQRTERERESPLASTSYDEGPQVTALIVYTARYYSGMPFQDPVPVLIKEFLPEARPAAQNELRVMQQLVGGLPEEKWQAAMRRSELEPPLVSLLGYYMEEQSMTAGQITVAEGQSSDPNSLWMVYKWEGLRPLSMYSAQAQTPPAQAPMFSMFRRGAPGDSPMKRATKSFLRALIRGCLEALEFCHSRGVSHGSIGPGCVLLSTLENRDAEKLRVKLDNFGTAVCTPIPVGGLSSSDTVGQEDDCFATGVMLIEAVYQALCVGSGAEIEEGGVHRLLCDVFGSDMAAFKDYCQQEDALEEAVGFLNEGNGAGWALLGGLVAGRTAGSLIANDGARAFLTVP